MATLLVAVVGATFAYFTATTASEGSGTANNNVTTADVGNQLLNLTDEGQAKADMKYPGGKMVLGAKVVASVDGGGAYDFTYHVGFEIDTTKVKSENTKIKYTLYETTTPAEGDLMGTCELTEDDTTPGQIHYFYGTGTCTVNTTITSATAIATNEITVHSAKTTVDVNDSARTFENVTSSTLEAQRTKYYYLVVEYLNDTENSQNDDKAQENFISAQITGIKTPTTKVHAE